MFINRERKYICLHTEFTFHMGSLARVSNKRKICISCQKVLETSGWVAPSLNPMRDPEEAKHNAIRGAC